MAEIQNGQQAISMGVSQTLQILQRLEAWLAPSHLSTAVPPAFQSGVLPELGPSTSSLPCSSSLSMPHYQPSGGIMHTPSTAGMSQSLHVNPGMADFADNRGNCEPMFSGFSVPQIDMPDVHDSTAFGLVCL